VFFLSAVIFFSQPSFTGFDFFNPPVLVNLPVVLKAANAVFLVGFTANLLGIYLFQKSRGKKGFTEILFYNGHLSRYLDCIYNEFSTGLSA
jgi:hypothetical protein